ncbi:MAG: hypothetical protein KUG71_08265 [Porticoccaceae bacterium]|nr:hypothetical protein [Porticoccaceae bacterium]
MIASATRLRLRSIRYLLPFLWQVKKVRQQVKKAPGNCGIDLRKSQGLAFWTRTLWKDVEDLQRFQSAGAHETGKPKLSIWCDEAVHTHWACEKNQLPTWEEAEKAMVKHGRLGSLDFPSRGHSAGEINTR